MPTSPTYRAKQSPGPGHLLALFVVTAAMLAYEVALARLIAIQHWYHLAPLIIAIALLGFGSAAAIAALWAQPLRAQARYWLFGSALLLSLSVVGGAMLAGRVPLNMLALPWQNREALHLLLYGLIFLPAFLAGGLYITLYFLLWPAQAGRVYAFDLLGSASGALAILFVVRALGLETSLLLVALLPLAAALWLVRRNMPLTLLCGAIAVAVVVSFPHFNIEPAEYKSLTIRQTERGSELLLQRDGLTKRLSVLDSPGLHAAPGLSLASRFHAPQQWQLFIDGNSAVPLLLETPPAALFSETLGHAPYLLSGEKRRVLLLDAGNLWLSWTADAAGAEHITALSPDPGLLQLLHHLKRRSGGGIHPDTLHLQHASARRYLQSSTQPYDVVVLQLLSPEAGIAAMQENYLLTREGLAAAFAQLSPGGVLAIQLRLHTLPRESLRLISLLAELLRDEGRQPQDHIAMLRDWHSGIIVAGRAPLEASRIEQLSAWAQRWQFDIVAAPGIDAHTLATSHQAPMDYIAPVQALLSPQAAQLRRDYVFDISPTSDNRPFFHQFFRWQSLAHLRETSGPMWRQHVEWGYLLGVATLISGALLAFTLLALPFALIRRSQRRELGAASGYLLGSGGYFLGIGLGFMLVEIALLHKAVLLLDATALAMSTVLAATLAGAGLGSLILQGWQPRRQAMLGIFALIAILAMLALPLIAQSFTVAAGWSLLARIALVVAIIAAVSIPMGMPLPYAIRQLQQQPPATIAWAWAVNGFASVIGTLGAVMIAVHWGLLTVMAVGVLCYGLAAACLWTLGPASGETESSSR